MLDRVTVLMLGCSLGVQMGSISEEREGLAGFPYNGPLSVLISAFVPGLFPPRHFNLYGTTFFTLFFSTPFFPKYSTSGVRV